MTRPISPAARPRAAAPAVVIAARDRTAAGARSGTPGRRGLTPTIARWPLDVDGDLESRRNPDPAIAIVRQSLTEYRSGRADEASRAWAEDIAWCVRGEPPVGGEWIGAEGVFAYHGLLERLSGGTFRQRLIALEGSRGSIVDAYLRTTATRKGRRLDIPTLAVFELSCGRVQRVTELPGDHDAWEAFWAD
jgi:ketosteroid isomerase-like protein